MHAIVFADREGRDLAPLTDRTCVALLPLAGKSVLEHTLESLAVAGVDDCSVVVGDRAEQVRRTFGDGRRWGLNLRYASARPGARPEQQLRRLEPGERCLILRGDVLRTPLIEEFLQRVGAGAAELAHAFAACGSYAHLSFYRGGPVPALPRLGETLAQHDGFARIELPALRFDALDSLAAFHSANLDAAVGAWGRLLVPGRAVDIHPRLLLGRGTRIDAGAVAECDGAVIGSHCTFGAGATLHGRAVIGDSVCIDSGAVLHDSVVLPDTYVGEQTHLKNAIASGNDLIRIGADGNAVKVKIPDAFLLADLQSLSLGGHTVALLDRAVAASALLLSLPLWPIAAAAAALEQPNRLLDSVQLRGNKTRAESRGRRVRSVFDDLYWSTSIPLLRHLPRLLAVVRGHLRLVGVTPLTRQQADGRSADWEQLGDRAPAGLIGPAALDLPAGATLAERLMCDALYAQQRSALGDLRLLGRGLAAIFSRRAWAPRPAAANPGPAAAATPDG